MAWGSVANIKGPTGATGSTGSQGATGNTGSAGTNGSTWFSGTGTPSSGTGVNGDYYLRTTTGDVYQKASGAWGSPIENITGPQGATGSTGAAAPVNETVNNIGAIATGAQTLPALTGGTMMTGTLNSAAATTFTMPTAAAGASFSLALHQPSSGTVATATFSGVVWPAVGAPVLTPTLALYDIFTFMCFDGSTWLGSYVQGF